MFTLGLGQGGGTPASRLLVRKLGAESRCEVVVSDAVSLVGIDCFAVVIQKGLPDHFGEVEGGHGGVE